MPYNGDEPFIFISYSHADSKIVYPIVEKLLGDGYRVWYDEGIPLASIWETVILDKLDKCKYFIFFVSANSCKSKWCQRELKIAKEKDKKIAPIYLEDTVLTDVIYTILNKLQAILKFKYDDESNFYTNLYEQEEFNQFRLSDFEIVDGVLVKYKGKSTEVTIPNNVTSIGLWAFHNCTSLRSITIPNSVESIGMRAFESCSSLTSIIIPNSVTSIDSFAFKGCSSLTSITIPNSVESIGRGAFESCSSLTNVTIPDGVTSIGNNEFSGCTSLISITIPNSVKSIGEDAFKGCDLLESVTIGNSVTSIGNMAFSDCISLTSITIPDSVTSIGSFAFSNCTSLTSINVDKNNQKYKSENGVLYSKDGKTLICYPPCKTDTSFIVPYTIKILGDWAFEGCSSLTSITIPNNVKNIGYGSFCVCDSLTSVTI